MRKKTARTAPKIELPTPQAGAKAAADNSADAKTGAATVAGAAENSAKTSATGSATDGAKASANVEASPASPRLSAGGRNLIILGVGATLIAILTTTIGLAIYHLSGDIYLDRSRPGYLPDEAEVIEEAETEPEAYTFEGTGKITREVLEEYLQHYSEELNAIDSYKDPFAASALSDEHLGIPKE